jgi:hypothetical protein
MTMPAKIRDEYKKLHPDLLECLDFDSESGCWIIDHPLLRVDIPDIRHLNETYLAQLDGVNKYRGRGFLMEYVLLHERSYQLQAFMGWVKEFGPHEHYWDNLSYLWRNAGGNGYEQYEDWVRAWTADVPNRHLAMTARAKRQWAKLPEMIQVYRGAECLTPALSWSLSRKRAEWFARRCHGFVYEGRVRKQDVFAFLTSRYEQEIVSNKVEVLRQLQEN